MPITSPAGENTSKACRAALRDDFDKLVREAALAGWSTKVTAEALTDLAHDLGDRARVYQNFGLMDGQDDSSE